MGHLSIYAKGTEPEKQRPKKGCRKGHLCEGRGIGRKKSGTGIKKGEHMIILDYKDARPIYEQVVEKFKLLILKGILEKGEQMPSVRSLAMDLSINPNTIQKAYAELERQGYIYAVKGRGNFISDNGNLLNGRKEELKKRLKELYQEGKELGMAKSDFMDWLNQLDG
jgi:Predicted transcriptional regulators